MVWIKDEIKDYKKSTANKILQGNSLLGLDVIAYDSNYNRLDTSEATTIFLFNELIKNSAPKGQPVQAHGIVPSSVAYLPTINDDSDHFDDSRVREIF